MTAIFAFGSNLDAPDRDAWFARHGYAGARLDALSPAWLLDRRLTHERHSQGRGGGVLTLASAPGECVAGIVFTANEVALEALDAKEGHPHAYERLHVHAILPDGAALSALTWDVPAARRHAESAPTPEYVAIIARGRAAHGLSMEGAPWLFVYGTLREGLPNAHLLEGLPRRPATCRGVLHDHGAYPVMTLGEGRVTGEILPLDPARLAALDALEGAQMYGDPSGTYRRTILPVTLLDGTVVPAQLYVKDAASGPRIHSGDWLSVGDRRAAWAVRTQPS